MAKVCVAAAELWPVCEICGTDAGYKVVDIPDELLERYKAAILSFAAVHREIQTAAGIPVEGGPWFDDLVGGIDDVD